MNTALQSSTTEGRLALAAEDREPGQPSLAGLLAGAELAALEAEAEAEAAELLEVRRGGR